MILKFKAKHDIPAFEKFGIEVSYFEQGRKHVAGRMFPGKSINVPDNIGSMILRQNTIFEEVKLERDCSVVHKPDVKPTTLPAKTKPKTKGKK